MTTLYTERLSRRRSRAMRDRFTPDGREKMVLSIMTRDLETARAIWPYATERDLGDLKLYWDPTNKAEDAAAKSAFQNAKKKGIAFYQLYSAGARDGKLLNSWDEVDREAAKRVQSAPPVRGGRDEENPMERAIAAGVRDGKEFAAGEPIPQSVVLYTACTGVQVRTVREGSTVRLDVGPPWARWWLTTEQAMQIADALEVAIGQS